MISSELIDTGTIDIVSDALCNQNPVAIDTEFMREKTYYATFGKNVSAYLHLVLLLLLFLYYLTSSRKEKGD